MRKLFVTLSLILVLTTVLMFAAACSSDKSDEGTGETRYDNFSTYVFFGVDSRAEGEEWKTDDNTGTDGAPSSDVIMLLSVNNDSKEAKIISVYRDTMLDIAGDGSDFEKCNKAYSESGPYGAIDMLEKNLDLYIDGYVAANFMAVADAIDLLGGVTVNVEDENTYEVISENKGLKNVVDTTNSYIREMNRVYHTETPLLDHAGEQELTGMQAVAYSRVRYTEGSDRKRTYRQRNVVLLMAQKLKEADPETQNRVLKEMYKKVDTDLAENELMSLFDCIVGYDLKDLSGFPFYMNSLTDEYKGEMLVPCDLKNNVGELHRYLYDNNDYAPSMTVLNYDEAITDETGYTSEDVNEGFNNEF